MRRLLTICLVALFALSASPQTQKKGTRQKAATTATAKQKTTKKTAKTTKKQKNSKQSNKAVVPTTKEIKGLQNQRAQVQKKIKEQERLLQANKADVKQRLNNLMTINSEINEHQRSIDDIQKDIVHLDGNIQLLNAQLATLDKQLAERKEKYVKSMRYMARRRSVQEQLMFVFSADNLTQMYRRMRFMHQYAAFQRAQGEQLKEKQAQIASKHEELRRVKGEKNNLLYKGKQAQAALQEKQTQQQQVVSTLQQQQKAIQGIIDEQRRRNEQLNAEIDRLVAVEVEKARKRAEEEARKKAAEAAAAKKKREEELARKKAAAEAAARENERRIAEAREREEKAKAEARAAAKKDEAARRNAEREARKAQAEREAAERKARVERERHEKEVAKATKENTEAFRVSSVDRKLSSNFESNRGRLPIPITGGYRIVSHYGQYNVEGLKNVRLDNKGINIMGQPGAQARAIFDGEVSAVFSFSGSNVVMVRHGSYISVYCNLKTVNVHSGQKVSTRQVLGAVGSDNILQFQLRRETAKLNPEVWLGR